MAARHRSDLGNEVHSFARARTIGDLASADMPLLRELAGDDRDQSLIRLIDGAVSHLPQIWMRDAAKILLVGEDRWARKLTDRQLEAAENTVNLTSVDGWTKHQTNSLSYHDQLLEAIAEILLSPAADTLADSQAPDPELESEPIQPEPAETEPTESAPHAVGPAATSISEAADDNQGRWRVRSLAAVGTLALVVLAAWVLLGRNNDQSATAAVTDAEPTTVPTPTSDPTPAPTSTPTPTVTPTPIATSVPVVSPPAPSDASTEADDQVDCSVGLGEGGASLSATQEDDLARWATELIDLAGSLCAAEPVAAFGDGLIQELSTAEAGSAAGAMFVAPGGTPVRLTEPQYVSYLEIAGRGNAQNSRTFGGYPTAATVNETASVIELSAGGLLIGKDPEQIHFWVSTNVDVRATWESTGGIDGELGLPMSNPFQPQGLSTEKDWYQESWWYQEYEFGTIVAPFLDTEQVAIEYAPDRFAPLGDLDLSGELINQAGGQPWLIDEQGVAHWIPSDEVWDCVNGGKALVMRDVPGYTIAALGLGPIASC